jgi:hypothetical protein
MESVSGMTSSLDATMTVALVHEEVIMGDQFLASQAV